MFQVSRFVSNESKEADLEIRIVGGRLGVPNPPVGYLWDSLISKATEVVEKSAIAVIVDAGARSDTIKAVPKRIAVLGQR